MGRKSNNLNRKHRKCWDLQRNNVEFCQVITFTQFFENMMSSGPFYCSLRRWEDWAGFRFF